MVVTEAALLDESVIDAIATRFSELKLDFSRTGIGYRVATWNDAEKASAVAWAVAGGESTDGVDALLDLAESIVLDNNDSPADPVDETREQALTRLKRAIEIRLEARLAAHVRSESAKAAAKFAKAEAKDADAELIAVVAQFSEIDGNPNWKPSQDRQKQFVFGESDSTNSDSQSLPATNDPAKIASVEQLSLTEAMHEKLLEADISTIADLEASISHDRLSRIKGVGVAAVDKITDALVEWRRKHGYGSPATE